MNKGNVITRRLHRCICVYIWCRCRVYIKISFWMKTCVELCVRIFLCVFTSFLFVILCIQIHYINTFSLCSNNVNQTQEMNKKKIIFIGVLHWFSWLVLKGFLSFSFSFFCCSILVSFQCFTTKHIQHKKHSFDHHYNRHYTMNYMNFAAWFVSMQWLLFRIKKVKI